MFYLNVHIRVLDLSPEYAFRILMYFRDHGEFLQYGIAKKFAIGRVKEPFPVHDSK